MARAKTRSTREPTVSVEYLLVIYKDDLNVLADGDRVGIANHTLMLPANEYTVTLEGNGYVPQEQDVVLAGTSIMRPKVVQFT
jgi:hypothetical protein